MVITGADVIPFPERQIDGLQTYKNIYTEGELLKDSTVAKFTTVQSEGERSISREIEYYNLDVIISVDYRVKSQRSSFLFLRGSLPRSY